MKTLKYAFIWAVAALGMTSVVACSDDTYAEQDKGKTPEIFYARKCDPAKADSMLTAAYMGDRIAFVGRNLGDVQQVWFNDQKSRLNPTMVTSNTIIVDVPNVIPGEVTNKARFITSAGKETVIDFAVIVPAPVVKSMNCEWVADGQTAVINGSYFIDDPSSPITITLNGNLAVPYDQIKVRSLNELEFVVPEGATEGYITVGTINGHTRSNFVFRDSRYMMFDFDGLRGTGMAMANGWRSGEKIIGSDINGIPSLDGNYICFSGTKGDRNDWSEDSHSINFWPNEWGDGTPELSTLFPVEDWMSYQVKFEAFVPAETPWMLCGLQFIFTNAEIRDDNAFINDDSFPRGIWMPWNDNGGTYDTAGRWVTVAMPLSQFNLTFYANSCSASLSPESFGGLTVIVSGGPDTGLTSTNVTVAVDNIRFAPVNE